MDWQLDQTLTIGARKRLIHDSPAYGNDVPSRVFHSEDIMVCQACMLQLYLRLKKGNGGEKVKKNKQ